MKSVFFLVFIFFSVDSKTQEQLSYEGEKVIYRDSMNGSENFIKRVKMALYEYGQNFPALGYHYNVGQVPYFVIYDDSLELLARVIFLTGKINPTAWKFIVKYTRQNNSIAIEIKDITWLRVTHTSKDSATDFTIEDYGRDPKKLKPIERNTIEDIDSEIKSFIAVMKKH
jgi:hypothetical protein